MNCKGLKNVDANKFGSRAGKQTGGDLLKGAVGALRSRKAAAVSKENAAPVKAPAGKTVSRPVESAAPLLPAQAKEQHLVSCLPAAGASESLTKKYSEIGDIDRECGDYKDCLLVSPYVKDIFSYLLQLETTTAAVRPDFLQSPAKLEITPRMRAILLDWLVQVHQRFSLLPETLYLTYHIIDAYMSTEAGAGVSKSRYQLIGVAAMMLASKYEEIYPPNVADFVYVTDNAYSAANVTAMECRILSQLGYFLGYPLPIQFLRRYSKVAGATPAVHEAAKYLAELARADYAMAHLPPSALAAAAFCLARQLLPAAGGADQDCDQDCGDGCGWTDALEVFSGYSWVQLAPLVRMVAGIAVRAGESVKLTAIRKKFSSNAVSMVSMWPELSSANVQLRAAAGISSSPASDAAAADAAADAPAVAAASTSAVAAS